MEQHNAAILGNICFTIESSMELFVINKMDQHVYQLVCQRIVFVKTYFNSTVFFFFFFFFSFFFSLKSK